MTFATSMASTMVSRTVFGIFVASGSMCMYSKSPFSSSTMGAKEIEQLLPHQQMLLPAAGFSDRDWYWTDLFSSAAATAKSYMYDESIELNALVAEGSIVSEMSPAFGASMTSLDMGFVMEASNTTTLGGWFENGLHQFVTVTAPALSTGLLKVGQSLQDAQVPEFLAMLLGVLVVFNLFKYGYRLWRLTRNARVRLYRFCARSFWYWSGRARLAITRIALPAPLCVTSRPSATVCVP